MRAVGCWVLLLSLCRAVASSPASPDPNRPELAELKEDRWEVMEEYESPFLVTMTATATTLTPTEARERILKRLQRGRLSIPGHFEKAKSEIAVTPKSVPLPDYAVEGDQLEGIKECTREYCKMKLNTKEKGAVEESKNKVQTYHQLVIRRLEYFLQKREIWGYEDRGSNIPFLKVAIGTAPFFRKTYPDIAQFLAEGFWKKASAPPSFKEAFLRQEKLFMSFEKMQPTWRLGEVFVFETKQKGALIAVIDAYSNHFFDSIFSFYEIIPWGKKTVLTMLDLMEVDELKKSAFIRLLFKGKMQEAVATYQKNTLKELISTSK